jgi:SAM-dependent methyltransferase
MPIIAELLILSGSLSVWPQNPALRNMALMLMSSRLLLVATLLLCAAVSTSGQDLGKLPYVPTPQKVVDEMINLANVTDSDFVIDLGSGDGRTVITAAKHGAKGFGVDIDPRLVSLGNKNARSEGVADRVQFFERDMFKTDIAKASVLFLYVLPDFMTKLRPKVLAELRPGARIVAHDYHMDDWHPDEMITLTVPEKVPINGTDKAYVYLWIIPAEVKGPWRLFFDTAGKTQQLNVTFEQEYQMLSATGEHAGKPMAVENTTLRGDEISFTLNFGAMSYKLQGKVAGDKIEGKAVAGKEVVKWLARRMP